MATAVHHTDHRATSEAVSKDQAEYIPDVIEEKRKDAEGRISITKYARGKLLGKVFIINRSSINSSFIPHLFCLTNLTLNR
jgi:hypothetical protein